MNKLNEKVIILSTLALVLSLGLFGCVKTQKPVVNTNQNQNTNTKVEANANTNVATTTEEIDTSNWKTYRNEEYGFEFKYPEDWKIDFLSNGQASIFNLNLFKWGPTQREGTEFFDGGSFKVSIFKIDNGVSLEKWLKIINKEVAFNKASFQGYNVMQYIGKIRYGDREIEKSKVNNIYFIGSDNLVYNLYIYSVGDSLDNYFKQLEKILETFKSR